MVKFYGNQFKCNNLRKETYSALFASFLKSTSNFEHFEKEMTLIAYVFLKLQTAKDVVR